MKNTTFKNIKRGAASLAVAAGISLAAGTAFAQDETSMAPPIQSSAPAGNYGTGTNAAADSVFNWQEIPANQQVPLTRATFDQGGYQLYDTVGETIVIPFTNNNLYVMKFATSQNGTLYFENQGGYPVLYVPKGGYLENATVAGARWYPFGQDFHPAEPVFLGIAPSYPEFIDLGWYPNTCFYGGYYGNTSFLAGGIFLPTVGLFFSIGGHPYYGWNAYHNYYFAHPGFYHTGYYNRNFYHYAGNNFRAFAPDRRFSGGFNHGYAAGFNHGFNSGVNHGFASHSQYAGHTGFGGNSGFSGRTFRGASNYGNGSHNYTVNRSTTVNNYGGGQHFGGGQNFGGGQSSARAFRGASSYGGGQSYGGSRSFGGGQSYSGGSFSGARQSYSRPSISQNSGGSRGSFGGGSRGSNSGGGGNRGGGGGGNRGGGGGNHGR